METELDNATEEAIQEALGDRQDRIKGLKNIIKGLNEEIENIDHAIVKMNHSRTIKWKEREASKDELADLTDNNIF